MLMLQNQKLFLLCLQKDEKLMGIVYNGYTYRTKLGKGWYYCIPIEELPFLN